MTPERLRQLHANASWRDDEWRRVRHAFPAGRVDHISAERNGNVWDVQYVSSLESFAEGMVRGAVILGTERVCALPADWARGAAVPFRIVGILDSLALDRPVSPGRGIRVEPLPAASDQLRAGLPERPGLVHYAYLGRTLVSVDAEAAPPLFHPQDPVATASAVRTTLNADLAVEEVSKALSLLWDESHVHRDQTAALQRELRGDIRRLSQDDNRNPNRRLTETNEKSVER